MKKFTPLLDRIVVKRLDFDEKSKKGVLLPTGQMQKKYDATRGEIVGVGPGTYNSFSSKWVELKEKPFNFEIGQVVIYPKAAGVEINVEGETLYVLSATDIYGKIEECES